MSHPVRLALIGCGRIAQVAHLPAMEKADGVQLIAVADPSAAVAGEVARRFGVETTCTDAADILADPAVEGVVITAPDRFHFSIARQALEAGKLSPGDHRSRHPRRRGRVQGRPGSLPLGHPRRPHLRHRPFARRRARPGQVTEMAETSIGPAVGLSYGWLKRL